MWDAYSSSRRRQRPIGFPPELRLVHPAHPLRHATQVEKSSRGCLRPICCLAAPRAREARRRGSVRDGARRRQNRLTRRRRGIARRRSEQRGEGMRSGARERRTLIPEARVGGRAPTQNGGGASSRTGPLSRAYFASASCGRWKRNMRLALPPPARRALRPVPSRRGLRVLAVPIKGARCSGSVTHA